jgi:glycosyltransferase involved in cell wall biosynthesis
LILCFFLIKEKESKKKEYSFLVNSYYFYKKQILNTIYISYDGMTDPLGQSQVIPYLKGLTEKGHSFHLISCEKHSQDSDEFKNIQSLLEKLNITWHPLKYTSRPPVISTIADIIKISNVAKSIIRKNKIDAIHCRGYISAMVGLKMKRKYGVKFLFDMRGFFADERVEGRLWNLKNPLYNSVYKYFKKKEKQFFTKADYSVSITEKAKAIIQSWDLPGQPVPIDVISCCADMELFKRENVDESLLKKWKQKLEIQDHDFVLSYLGSLGTWYMLDEMLDFFKVLMTKKTSAKFLFISPDDPRNILTEAASKNIPKEKIIIQKASRSEVPVMLALSHVSVFFIKPVFSKKASSATKMGEIMGMGIPLICNSNVGDVDAIMDDAKAGIVLGEFNNDAYLKAVESIDEVLKIPPESIRAYAKKYYSLEDGVEKYNSIYKKLSLQ